jgi:dTDP-4-amino-4,6-dideoxygalactose transaminase
MTAPDEAFLPFAFPDIGEEEIAEVVDTMRSGWLTTGKKAKQFEDDFAAYLGGGVECIAVNSATAALHLGLEALGIGPGDEVIVPTHTFTATAEVVEYLHATPVFVDIDRDTYCLSPAAVERALTERTKAIIPVHYAGHPADMEALLAIAKRAGVRVLDDAAHAFPTRFDGELVGTLATDATAFSFYANKTMTTGEGGMLVTRDPAIARRARVMRLHGIDRDAFDRYTSTKPAWYYEVVAPGFKDNLSDVAASIGIHQLRKIDRFLERRIELADRYDAGLAELPLRLPPRPTGASTHAWHLYVVRLDPGARLGRDELIAALYERGIGCSVHFIPLHHHPYWRDRYGLTPDQFPESETMYGQAVSIPLFTRMTDADQDRVIEALRDLLGR